MLIAGHLAWITMAPELLVLFFVGASSHLRTSRCSVKNEIPGGSQGGETPPTKIIPEGLLGFLIKVLIENPPPLHVLGIHL